ncbi:MAG: AcrB/AcrD/AcrF family protein, partial [Verrucomicrobia bacterium]
TLPPGAREPVIGDDFGFVYGFMLAVTGDGYSYAELETAAKELRKELSVVKGVSRVLLHSVQPKRIYIDVSQPQIAALGLTPADIQHTLLMQNMVVDAGHIEFQDSRFRIAPTGEFSSPEEIADLAITTSPLQDKIARMEGHARSNGEIIRIRDIGTVSVGYKDPPDMFMRYNGMPAVGILLAPGSGENVVKLGGRVEQKLNAALKRFPVGLEVNRVAWQSDLVDLSIKSFMINLLEAILIVLVVLIFSMGFKTGVIIGVTGLIYPILGTFIIMAIAGIDLQRVSLGALIIAMGMMVDNAIVVADNMMVRLQQGMDRTKAAIEAASLPSMPLLGATVVASMAFYPIFASTFDTGEYAGSLFSTVAISLILSWLFCQTITPLVCIKFMPDPKKSGSDDMYGGKFYQKFRSLLRSAIKFRMLFLGCMVGLLLLSIYGFGFTNKMYFPDSSRDQFMIDYWLPEGTRIQQTSSDLEKIEAQLMGLSGVVGVTSLIGQGQPRFYLPVVGEDPYPSFGQIIVNTKTLAEVDTVKETIEPWLKSEFPQALSRVRKYAAGAFDDWKFEARFSGPLNADPNVLRNIAAQGMAILNDSPLAKEVRTNWRTRTRRIVPRYNQERGRYARIGRTDVAAATKRSYEGVQVGLYREKDDLIPIVVRSNKSERDAIASNITSLQVTSPNATESVPMGQVIDDIELEWEDPVIWRWNRRRAISVQCSPDNTSADALRNGVLAQFEAIPLPPGYTLEWDGEFFSQLESAEGLQPGLLPAFVIMLFIIVLLFNAYRPPMIIIILIPFAAIGITVGLLVTGAPFGFMALLGAMSLAGMMIKNVVVLLDQINQELAGGLSSYEAVVRAALSRLRPVVNAAATTVFGMAPLLQDGFWYSMAITIMFGLAFGTILTMVVVPVLYAAFYKIKIPEGA